MDLAVRTRHDSHGLDNEQPAHKGEKQFSTTLSRWLEEPAAEGPYSGIAGVVGWERCRADGEEGTNAGERKKRGGEKKNKPK